MNFKDKNILIRLYKLIQNDGMNILKYDDAQQNEIILY